MTAPGILILNVSWNHSMVEKLLHAQNIVDVFEMKKLLAGVIRLNV